MILLLSNKWDLTVDFIVAELRRRNHPFIRLNTEDLPTYKATVHLPDFRFRITHNGAAPLVSDDVSVIWNRRPGQPFDDLPQSQRPSPAIQRFTNDQWSSWLEALKLVPNVFWINHPEKNARMESKLLQLLMASQLGFNVPDTVVTNDLSEASALLKTSPSGLVAKALYSPLIEEPDSDSFIFANRLTDLPPDASVELRQAPVIFQPALVPKVDYRVTVVADRVFPVRISIPEDSSAVDWRTIKDNSVSFVPHDLPKNVLELCRDLVNRADLVFGAIDLVEHRDDFFFLEINPNGEWGWLQKPHGIPIAEALCDVMIRHEGAPAR